MYLRQEQRDAEATQETIEEIGQDCMRRWRNTEKKVPMERPAQPEEIAPAYVFFASDADSSYVTGEILTLLGGETTAA